MTGRARGYYYGSYGIVRGYGKLCQTLKEADESVFDDGRLQRRNGGSTDRNAVAVTAEDGLCWWTDEEGESTATMPPVKTASGKQARYEQEVIRAYELLWETLLAVP